jgi:hypothetical protein
MAVLRFPPDEHVTDGETEIRMKLGALGIDYERWDLSRVDADAPAEAVLAAYAEEIEAMKQRGGYVTADVIDVTPETPNLDAMLARFDKEHTHSEDEVRFILAGRGIFFLHHWGECGFCRSRPWRHAARVPQRHHALVHAVRRTPHPRYPLVPEDGRVDAAVHRERRGSRVSAAVLWAGVFWPARSRQHGCMTAGSTRNDRPSVYLLDVEGTVAPIAFVYEQLFPYARARFAEFLWQNEKETEAKEARGEDVLGEGSVWRDLMALGAENRMETDAEAPRIWANPASRANAVEDAGTPRMITMSPEAAIPKFLEYIDWLMTELSRVPWCAFGCWRSARSSFWSTRLRRFLRFWRSPGRMPARRKRMARKASLTCFIVLTSFALGGQLIFRMFGITLPAFEIAGGLILLLIGLDMLEAKRSPTQEATGDTEEASHKEDAGIVPLGIPMLAGPGAISSVMVLVGQVPNAVELGDGRDSGLDRGDLPGQLFWCLAGRAGCGRCWGRRGFASWCGSWGCCWWRWRCSSL